MSNRLNPSWQNNSSQRVSNTPTTSHNTSSSSRRLQGAPRQRRSVFSGAVNSFESGQNASQASSNNRHQQPRTSAPNTLPSRSFNAQNAQLATSGITSAYNPLEDPPLYSEAARRPQKPLSVLGKFDSINRELAKGLVGLKQSIRFACGVASVGTGMEGAMQMASEVIEKLPLELDLDKLLSENIVSFDSAFDLVTGLAGGIALAQHTGEVDIQQERYQKVLRQEALLELAKIINSAQIEITHLIATL